MTSINLYNTTDDANVANKTLNLVEANVACDIYENCTMLQPRLILAYSETRMNCSYIRVFNRYYNIVSKDLQPGGKMVITCTIDAILTYWDQIKNLPCTVTRTGNSPTEIVDEKLPINPNEKYYVGSSIDEIELTKNSNGSLFEYGCYIANVIGSDKIEGGKT